MTTVHKGRLWITLALAIATALSAAAAVIFWHTRSDKELGSVTMLAQLEEQAMHLTNLELQAVASGGVDRQLLVEVAERRRKFKGLLAQLQQRDPDGRTLRPVQTAAASFVAAEARGLDLVARGRIAQAARFDRDQVNTSYESLEEEVERTSAAYGRIAARTAMVANLGSVGISLAAIALISFLLWGFSRAERIAAVQSAERKALERSEEHFRKLVQFSSDVTLVVDESATIQYASASAHRILGYRPEEICGRGLAELVHPGEEELVARFVEADAGDAAALTKAELRLATRDGRWLYVEAVGTNRLSDPAVGGIILNARDITKRKRAEDQVAEQNAELESRNSELSALYDVSEAVSRAASLDELFNRTLDSMDQIDFLGDWKQGGILLLEGGNLRLVAHHEKVTSQLFLDLHDNLAQGECLCGLAAQTGELIVSSNSMTDERHTLRCPGADTHGHVIVPLRAMGKIIGVMYLYTPKEIHIEERALRLLQVIGDRIGTAIETVRLFEHTRELSLKDPLTGLANRRLMHIELEKNFARARRLNRPFSVIMLDLDHFKNYNDSYGHAAGDRLLAQVASIILKETREMDLAVRYGGEEFLIVLPETRMRPAVETAERLRQSVMTAEFHPSAASAPAHVTISTGVATYSRAVTTEDQLTQMADQALYAAKENGRNRVERWAA